jgi:hypothetical protein
MKSFFIFIILLTFVLLASIAGFCQSAPASIYAESFRHGATSITEGQFEVKLTPKDRTFRERIKDSHGVDRYVFSIVPQSPEGDNQITAWQAKLADLHHTIYDNILLATQEPSSDPKNAPWRLDPSNFAPVPIMARRIIKVDSFYVVLEVKAFHFTPLDSPYLDSMTVTVNLTNSDPGTAESTQK